jgi:hypothetical protein
MAELLLVGTIIAGVSLAVVTAKASLAWVVDRIPVRPR